MKNKYYALSLAAIAVVFIACSSAKESTTVWVNRDKIQGKSFNNVFIMVMTNDLEARKKLETDLAAATLKAGYRAVKSIDVMAPTFTNVKPPIKEEIEKHVKQSGCDAVFVASLLKKEEKVRYTPGTTAYAAGTYYTWGGGGYFGYYNHFYPTVSTPGYYTQEKNYFMQSNLYDVTTEDAMWSVQSTIFAPSNLNRFSKTYTTSLIKQLEEASLLKK